MPKLEQNPVITSIGISSVQLLSTSTNRFAGMCPFLLPGDKNNPYSPHSQIHSFRGEAADLARLVSFSDQRFARTALQLKQFI